MSEKKRQCGFILNCVVNVKIQALLAHTTISRCHDIMIDPTGYTAEEQQASCG